MEAEEKAKEIIALIFELTLEGKGVMTLNKATDAMYEWIEDFKI